MIFFLGLLLPANWLLVGASFANSLDEEPVLRPTLLDSNKQGNGEWD